MKKSDKIIIGGAILSVIGIVIMYFGYDTYKSVEGVLTMMAGEAPPGVAQLTIGMLIAVVGVFTAIYGFGLLPEEPKMPEKVAREMEARPGYQN